MRIRKLGSEITKIPGVDYIRAEPSASSEGGVHILLKFQAMAELFSYGVKEFGEFLDAARLIHSDACDMIRENSDGD